MLAKIRILVLAYRAENGMLPGTCASCAILGGREDLAGRVAMAIALAQQSAGTDTVIPVIDLGPYLSGAPGALEATAAQLRSALETIGFFIIIHHDVPQDLIARTFAEARRFHEQPLAAKMALRMNEHNNGYMAMGKYAVWTSDVNANDKPDLNEAFFETRTPT